MRPLNRTPYLPNAVVLFNCTATPVLPVAWDWLPCTASKTLNDSSQNNFGASVAVSSDARTLAVTSAGSSAALFVFACVQPGWACEQTSTLGFGLGGYSTVAASADGRFVVTGTPESTAYSCGVARLLDCSSPPCVLASLLLPQGCAENATWLAGFAVAMSASTGVVAVGAPAAWNGTATMGAVFVYLCSTGSSTTVTCYLTATLFEPTGAEAAAFGHAVVLSADGSTLCVGAPGFSNSTGRVYFYTVAPRSGSCTLLATLNAQTGLGSGSRFGYSLAASADTSLLAVGSVATAADPTGLTFFYSGGPAGWAIAAEAHGAAYAGLALSARGTIAAFADPHGDAISCGYPFAEALWATPSGSPTQSTSPSLTASASRTPSTTTSASPSASQRVTPSPSQTVSASQALSITASPTLSVSQQATRSQSASQTSSRSPKPSSSGSGTRTPAATRTPTESPTMSRTRSQKESYHLTSSQSQTHSLASTVSASVSPSTTRMQTSSATATQTPSVTRSTLSSFAQSPSTSPASSVPQPSLLPVASVSSVLAARGLLMQAEAAFASASSVDRLMPLELPASEASAAGDVAVPTQVIVSLGGAPPGNGTGTARALLRAAAGANPPSTADPCSLTATDPLGGLPTPNQSAPTALGVRLLRHEATALIARLWLAPVDCPASPLALAIPITPQLAFISAFTGDARDVAASVSAGGEAAALDRLLLAPGCPAGPNIRLADCAAPYAALQRGVVARLRVADWVVSGFPTAAAVALNSTLPSSFFGALPAIHVIKLSTTTLSAALPPYALLPGYYYTATALLSLDVTWAWDTAAFESRSFPASTLPPSVATALADRGYGHLAAETEVLNASSPAPRAGAYSALALVALPTVMRGVAVFPPSGVALVDVFNVSAGPIESPDTAPLDTPPLLATPSFVSALLDSAPLPPSAQLALVGVPIANSPHLSAACAKLAALDSAAYNASLASSLRAWELDTTLLGFALAVAGAVGAAFPIPSAVTEGVSLAAGEGVAQSALAGALTRAPFAAAVPGASSPAALCVSLSARMIAALQASPLNTSSSAPHFAPIPDFENVTYSFRVGTLSYAPSASATAFESSALTNSVPIRATDGGDSFVAERSVLATLPLPLETDGLYALSSGSATNLSAQIFVIARSNTRVLAVASSVVTLRSPTSSSGLASIAALSRGYTSRNASVAPLPTILAAATLGALLSADSTARALRGTAVVVPSRVTSNSSGSFPFSYTVLNAETRSNLLNLTAIALAAMRVSHGQSSLTRKWARAG